MSEAEQLRAAEGIAARRAMGRPGHAHLLAQIAAWCGPKALQRLQAPTLPAFVLAAAVVKDRVARGEVVQLAAYAGARRVMALHRPRPNPPSRAELMLLPLTVIGITAEFHILIVRRPIGDLAWSAPDQFTGPRAIDMWMGARACLRRRFPHPDRYDRLDVPLLWGTLCEAAASRPPLFAPDLQDLGLLLTHRSRGGWAIRRLGTPRTAFAAGRIR